MITPVILPQLGDTMNEGTITRWLKREGDAVKKGEPLFEVLTDKANMEVEATTSGFLRSIVHQENESVPTGQVIAYLTTTADEGLTSPPDASSRNTLKTVNSGLRRDDASPTPLLQGEGKERATGITSAPIEKATAGEGNLPRKKQFISPRARRLATEKGVDLSSITPSSRSGRVIEADVLKFLAQQTTFPLSPLLQGEGKQTSPLPSLPQGEGKRTLDAAPASRGGSKDEKSETVIPITGIRKIIFERMGASSREVARVTLTTEADATRLVEMRDEINARMTEIKFSFTDLLALLVSRVLLKYPYMNATVRDDRIYQSSAVHLGIATETERGLLVPVLRNAHLKMLAEIYSELRRLSEAARTGKIAPDDLNGGTFTITNLGQYEIDAFTPIVNQPETAILGVGRIAQKPAAYLGQLALRWMVSLSLSFDHRVVDGAPAARFLQEVKRVVETPGLVLV